MGFEKFGKFGYVSQTKINALLSFLEKDQLAGTRCQKCKSLYFPPRADCPKCRNSKIDWEPIDGRGRLITFTEVHFAPPQFQGEAPYLLGLAELKDGLRVFAPINPNVDRKRLKPGLQLILRAAKRPGDGLFYQLER